MIAGMETPATTLHHATSGETLRLVATVEGHNQRAVREYLVEAERPGCSRGNSTGNATSSAPALPTCARSTPCCTATTTG